MIIRRWQFIFTISGLQNFFNHEERGSKYWKNTNQRLEFW